MLKLSIHKWFLDTLESQLRYYWFSRILIANVKFEWKNSLSVLEKHKLKSKCETCKSQVFNLNYVTFGPEWSATTNYIKKWITGSLELRAKMIVLKRIQKERKEWIRGHSPAPAPAAALKILDRCSSGMTPCRNPTRRAPKDSSSKYHRRSSHISSTACRIV